MVGRDQTMPKPPDFEIDAKQAFIGFALEAASVASPSVLIITQGIFGPESGNRASIYCESFFSDSDLARIQESAGHDFAGAKGILVAVSPEGRWRGWIITDMMKVQMRAARRTAVGEMLTLDDIRDVVNVDVSDFDVRSSDGYFLTIRIGFHRAIAFRNPETALPSVAGSQVSLGAAFAMAHSLLLHRKRHELAVKHIPILRDHGWFPFVGLSESAVNRLEICACTGDDWDLAAHEIAAEWIDITWPKLLDAWAGDPVFAPEVAVVRQAVDLMRQGNWHAVCALVVPRVEGVSVRAFGPSSRWPRSPALIADIQTAGLLMANHISSCFVVPFCDYLRDVFFASFDASIKNIKVTRHSLAHGAVLPTDVTQSHAIQALLCLQQLFYFHLQSTTARESAVDDIS